MSTAVYGLLDRFDHLTLDEQREFLAQLFQRTRELEWPPIDDESLDRIAEESFLEYDALEAADGKG